MAAANRSLADNATTFLWADAAALQELPKAELVFSRQMVRRDWIDCKEAMRALARSRLPSPPAADAASM